MAENRTFGESGEPDFLKEDTVQNVPIHHWDFPRTDFQDTLAAAKWAWSRVECLALAFCELHCDSAKCDVEDHQRRQSKDKAGGSDSSTGHRWRETQEDLHRALSCLPGCRDDVDGCPACAVVKAFVYFPILAKYSPVPPVATVKQNKVDCFPETAYVGGFQESSVPCCIFDSLVGDGSEHEIERRIRESALLHLDLENLPAIPPWELSQLKGALMAGQAVAKYVFRQTRQAPMGDFEKDEMFQVNLPTAITSAIALRDLIRLRRYYPDAIEAGEARQLHQGLVEHLESAMASPGYYEIKKQLYKRPDFDDLKADEEIALLFSLLLMHHPDLKIDPNDREDSQRSMKEAMQKSQEAAVDTVKQTLVRIMEVMIFDCRFPNPADDPSFQEPKRFLFLAQQYWALLRQVLLHYIDAPMGFHPNPLMRPLVNLRDRLERCLGELYKIEGSKNALVVVDQLFDTLLHGEPDELSVIPEWTTSRMSQVDVFLEEARLNIGASRYQLTREEQYFIEFAEGALANLKDETTKHWSRMLKRVDKMAADRAQTQPSENKQEEATDHELLVDLSAYRVVYRGVEIPTKGAGNLQRQPLLALAVLARHAGKTVSMARLAEEMYELGGLRRKPVAPDAGDIRYRILRPFKKHLLKMDGFTTGEIDGLVETISGIGLKLNIPSPPLVVT